MSRYFGTDGIRGPVDGPLINPAFFEKLGRAVAVWLDDVSSRDAAEEDYKYRIVIGRDPRPSGEALLQALVNGLGPDFLCLDAGVLPTPALARVMAREKADLGVMITASHNPSDDNGIKIFNSVGRKLEHDEERRLEGILDHLSSDDLPQDAAARRTVHGLDPYVESIQMLLPPDALKGWKIVLDTANGATRLSSSQVLTNLGADLVHVGDSEDGSQINAGCGSEFPAELAARVKATRSRLGFAHDGDGDRLLCVDETGTVIHGDQLLGMIALDGLKKGWLKEGKMVTTIQSNIGLDRALETNGGTVYRVPVGDRWVSEKMLEIGASFGGENSGHLIFGSSSTTGDGLLAAIMVLDLLMSENQPLSALASKIRLFPQAQAGLRVMEKVPLDACSHLEKTRRKWEAALQGRGRLLVRYSGTEAVLRFLVESETQSQADEALQDLLSAGHQDLEIVD